MIWIWKNYIKLGKQIQQKNAYHNRVNNNYYYVHNFIDIKSKSKIEYNKLLENINNLINFFSVGVIKNN